MLAQLCFGSWGKAKHTTVTYICVMYILTNSWSNHKRHHSCWVEGNLSKLLSRFYIVSPGKYSHLQAGRWGWWRQDLPLSPALSELQFSESCWRLSTRLTWSCLVCIPWHFKQGLNTTLCKGNQQNKPCLKHASRTLAAKEGSWESTYTILNTTCLTWPVFKTVCLILLANTFPNIVCFCSPDRLLFSNSPFRPSDTAGFADIRKTL